VFFFQYERLWSDISLIVIQIEIEFWIVHSIRIGRVRKPLVFIRYWLCPKNTVFFLLTSLWFRFIYPWFWCLSHDSMTLAVSSIDPTRSISL
jgi:hypothetical protein